MIDTIFWWVGAIVCGLGAFVGAGSLVMLLVWIGIEYVAKRIGGIRDLGLACYQWKAEQSAIESGDAYPLSEAIAALRLRVANAQARRGVVAKGREVEP